MLATDQRSTRLTRKAFSRRLPVTVAVLALTSACQCGFRPVEECPSAGCSTDGGSGSAGGGGSGGGGGTGGGVGGGGGGTGGGTGTPTQLGFATSAQRVQAGACSNPVTVESRDASGKVAPVSAGTPVTLTVTGVAVSLFADAACSAGLTAPVPLGGGSSSITFYFRGAVAGLVSVTAAGSGLTSATQVEFVEAGPPRKLVFTSAPRSASAGQCSALPVEVQAQDENSNPSQVSGAALAVSLGGPAGFTLYSDSACTSALGAGATIPLGGNTATAHFRGTLAGPQGITASAAPLTGALQLQTRVSPFSGLV